MVGMVEGKQSEGFLPSGRKVMNVRLRSSKYDKKRTTE